MDLRKRITLLASVSNYDHRPFMHESIWRKYPHTLDEEQLIYSRFKWAVAQVLKPASIYEVGVGWGISALAFKAGYPETDFYGIDNFEAGIHPRLAVNQQLDVTIDDSSQMTCFDHPRTNSVDLIHIDGGHGLEHKAADIVRAVRSRPEWILVDDIHDVMVAAGTFAGLYQACHNAPKMLMFEYSHTGNLLIHINHKEPEFRGLRIERI